MAATLLHDYTHCKASSTNIIIIKIINTINIINAVNHIPKSLVAIAQGGLRDAAGGLCQATSGAAQGP